MVRCLPSLVVVHLLLGGCVFAGDDAGSDQPPHTCDGASLQAVFDAGVDPAGFIAEVEAAITDVAITCDQRDIADDVIVSCGPAGQSCGFASRSDAEAHEPAFRDAIARFDPSLADYPYPVIDDCACRVY